MSSAVAAVMRKHLLEASVAAVISFVVFAPGSASSSIQTVELQACKIYTDPDFTSILCGVTGGDALANGAQAAYFDYRPGTSTNVIHTIARKTYTGSASLDSVTQAGGGDVEVLAANTKVDASVWDYYYLSVDLLRKDWVFDGVILVSN